MKNLNKDKTNVIRILETQSINYTVYEYPIADGLIDAINVARKIGVDLERVFKTLVTTGKKTGINIFLIPSNYELDLKKASDTAGEKSIEMLKAKELLGLTGYIHGGCSPIGMKKVFPIYVEEIASQYDYIVISAGKVGLQVCIDPRDLLRLTGFKYADLV